MARRKSDLPFGSDFSPTTRDLGLLLEFAHASGSDWKAFERRVRNRYTASHSTTQSNKNKLANNTKLGMRAYGLIEEHDATLTEVGRGLYELRNDPEQMYEEFARHILLNRHGMTLVQCVQDMTASGADITGPAIRRELEERGVYVPVNSRNHFTMRLWLEKAGVFVADFHVDSERVEEILGTRIEVVDALSQFTKEQRAYLATLATVSDAGPQWSNDVAKLAAAAHGVDFRDQGIPKLILYPLRDAGFVTLERGTKRSGRGAKPFRVTVTDLMQHEIIAPLVEQIEAQIKPEIRPLLRQSLADIRSGIASSNTHTSGLALEALAFKLMRLINLDYVATRLRGSQTGGAEVDLIFESARLVYMRWQIQCKNTKAVALDDVAKEVGLTHMTKSNAIVMVTTGKIGPRARDYAKEVMRTSNLCIMMLDGADLTAIDANPARIVDLLNREAKRTGELRPLELKE